MKYQIHEQTFPFEFAGVEFDSIEDASEAVVNVHEIALKVVAHRTGGKGIDKKDFDKIVDEYLTTKTIKNGGDVYGEMSLEQQNIIQTIKRSFARTK